MGIVDQEKWVYISSYIEPDVRRALERLAFEGERTLSAEVRRAIKAHVRECARLLAESHDDAAL